jgi:DNA-binding Xre family transcriptional regulator
MKNATRKFVVPSRCGNWYNALKIEIKRSCMLRLRVREVAEQKGYNMTSLSRASNISFNTIKRMWQKPYEGANTNTLNKIAQTLGVSTSELIEDVPDKQ